MVDALWNKVCGGVGNLPEYLLVGRIDRKDLAGVAVFAQITLRQRGMLVDIARCADESNALGCEQRLRQRRANIRVGFYRFIHFEFLIADYSDPSAAPLTAAQ